MPLRLLLLPLPAALRRTHGREMRQLARDRWREAGASGRPLARLHVAWWLLIDILRSAPAEHLARIRQARAARGATPRQRREPMSDVLKDLRYALCLAAASPMFTAAAVVTLALGLGAATAIYRSLLFGLDPQDPPALAAVAVALAAVAVVAAWIPARRAARVDPVIALRSE